MVPTSESININININIPSLRYQPESIVTPGDRIGSANEIASGPGTHIKELHVYASLVGKLMLTPSTSPATTSSTSSDMEVDSNNTHSSNSTPTHVASVLLQNGQKCATHQILSVGQVVLGRVVRIGTQQAIVEILAADNQTGPLKEPYYGGMIRKEDIKIGVTEEIDIYNCFRPGDIILARIISLGDARRYYLSTADNHLGVIRATCAESGVIMHPISWKEMECPETKIRELRKCAKPSESKS